MAFLTIAGTTYEVQTTGASERTRADRRAQTEGVATYAGVLRRQGVTRKREWVFTTAPLTQSEFAALVVQAYGAAFRSCAGDAMPAAIDCLITLEDGAYVEDTSDALGFKRIAQLTLRER